MRTYLAAACLLLSSLALADEPGAIRAFERASTTEPELIAFLNRMPKGGDLHNHFSGAMFSDFMLDAQIAQGRHFDPSTNTFTDDASKPPASQLLTDTDMLTAWLNKISMRGWEGLGQTGHDHFFNTFRYIGSANDGMTSTQILNEVVGRAMSQNVHYMELMTSTNSDAGYNAYFSGDPDTTSLSVALEALRPRLESLLKDSTKFIDARDAELSKMLKLKSWVDSPLSPMTLRYIWSCNRQASNDSFFTQAAGGIYLAAHEPRVVALNIVAPEDSPNARRNFDRQMEMLDYLWNSWASPTSLCMRVS